jgi:hypothetical protein
MGGLSRNPASERHRGQHWGWVLVTSCTRLELGTTNTLASRGLALSAALHPFLPCDGGIERPYYSLTGGRIFPRFSHVLVQMAEDLVETTSNSLPLNSGLCPEPSHTRQVPAPISPQNTDAPDCTTAYIPSYGKLQESH